MADKIRFLTGSLTDLENKSIARGEVYFAIDGDKGKILFDAPINQNTTKRILMGGDYEYAEKSEEAKYALYDKGGKDIRTYVASISLDAPGTSLIVKNGKGDTLSTLSPKFLPLTGGKITGELYTDSLTTGDLLVNGSARFVNTILGNIETADKWKTARNFITNLGSTSKAKVDGSQAEYNIGITGILPVANGGTGKNNGTDAANYFLNSLTTGSSNPVDNDYYISQYVNGGTTTTTFHRRPMSALWGYIKTKIKDVLILDETSYGGNAATADKWKNKSNFITNLGSTTKASVDGSQAEYNIGITGTLPIENGGTGATTAAKARENLSTLAALKPSGQSYYVMAAPDGSDNVWIRTTSQGLLPYQSGAAGSGHGNIGASSWYFKNAYIDNIYGNAASATKLKTARKIITALNSESGGSFDGSADVTIGVSGILPISHGGTGKSSWIANQLVYSNAANSLTNTGSIYTDGSHLGIGINYSTKFDLLTNNEIKTKKFIQANSAGINVLQFADTTTPKEILIKTKIKYVSSSTMPKITLHMYAYGRNMPVDISITYYIWDGNFVSYGATSSSQVRPYITLSKWVDTDSQEYVAIGLGLIGTQNYDIYFSHFYIDCFEAMSNNDDYLKGWTAIANNTDTTIIPTENRVHVEYKDQSATSLKWATACNFRVVDNDVTNSGDWVSVDGSAVNYTLQLPSTIKASITGHASKDLPLAGGTMTGNIVFADSTFTANPTDTPGISWSGGTDGAKIFYRQTANNAGSLVLQVSDDGEEYIQFRHTQGGVVYLKPNTRELYPSVDNSGSIGTTSYKWANMYATTFHGSLDGTANRATNDTNGKKITETYISEIKLDAAGTTIQFKAPDKTTYTEIKPKFLPLTGGTITGELYVDGGTTLASLLVNGDARFVNTIQGSISGNAGSANKWATAKAFYITDAEAKHTSSPQVNIDGSQSSYTLHLPSTIKAALEGNADTATIARSLGTDDTMKVYAQINNEVNFGGTGNSSEIYFGYRAKDSKPIPLKFVFGGDTGTAELVAAKFTGALIGNATSADKWSTARNFITNLGSESPASVDGSTGPYNLGVSGVLPVSHGGTGVTSIAEIKAGKDSDGNTISSTYLKLSGGTMTGNISYKGTNATNSMIRFIDNTTDTSGNGISIGGGGVTVIGAGESSQNLTPAANEESLYLLSDGSINFYTYCDTIGNKRGVILDTSRNFYPDANNNGSVGTSSNKWASMYASTFYGNLSGTASYATRDSNGQIITDTYLTNVYVSDTTKLYKTIGTSGDSSKNILIGSFTPLDADGLINIKYLPKGALERMHIVANKTARLALTTANVQNGDTVYEDDTRAMYYVYDDTKLNSEDGYRIYTAGTATRVNWSGVQNRPHVLGSSSQTNVISLDAAKTTFTIRVVEKTGTESSYTLTPNFLPLTGGTITGELYADSITAGSLLVKGDARFVNTIQGNISGNAGSATKWATEKAFYIADAEAKHTSSPQVNIDGSKSSYTLHLPSTIKATLEGNASSATKLTNLTSADQAFSTNTWRRIWFAYDDNVTGRPAYSDTFAYQSSTGTVKATKFQGTLVGNATSADKWSTARNFITNLGSESPASVDGSTEPYNLGVTGTLPVSHGGTGNIAQTANRAVYSETATKLSSSGHYMSSSKMAINSTSEPLGAFYVNGTANINGIRFLNGSATAGKTHLGWIKIASMTINTSNHFGEQNLIISLSRNYNSPASESYIIALSCGWDNARLSQISGQAGIQIIKQFRIVIDKTNHIAYLEMYIDKAYATYANSVSVHILSLQDWATWTLLNEVQAEDDSAFTIYDTLTLNGTTASFVGILDGKFANARTFITALNSESSGSFDGSANVTLGVSGTLPINHGGTGNNAFTASRAIYAETATKLSSSGHYMSSSKLSINSTIEPGYHFYVNGTSYFSGVTTHGAAVNFANSTWNLVGDDVYFGDHGVAGGFGIYGKNGNTRLDFCQYNAASTYQSIIFDGNTLYASSKFGVNGSNSSYNFYVNGTSYLNGNLTVNSSGKVKIENAIDSTYSEDTNAALDIKGGVSVDKQMSAKSIRIDNNSKDKGCTLIMNLDLNCLEFVFN